MSLLYSFASADSSPHPPSCNSFICLFALLWFWFFGVFCLFKESMQVKLRLFRWTKYDLCEGVYPQVNGFYQGRKFPSPFWNSLFPALFGQDTGLISPSYAFWPLTFVCSVAMHCLKKIKSSLLKSCLGGKFILWSVSHFSQKCWGKEGLLILGRGGGKR